MSHVFPETSAVSGCDIEILATADLHRQDFAKAGSHHDHNCHDHSYHDDNNYRNQNYHDNSDHDMDHNYPDHNYHDHHHNHARHTNARLLNSRSNYRSLLNSRSTLTKQPQQLPNDSSTVLTQHDQSLHHPPANLPR